MVDYKKKYLKYKKKYLAIKKLKGGMWNMIKYTLGLDASPSPPRPSNALVPAPPPPPETFIPAAVSSWHAAPSSPSSSSPPRIPFFGCTNEEFKNINYLHKNLLQQRINEYMEYVNMETEDAQEMKKKQIVSLIASFQGKNKIPAEIHEEIRKGLNRTEIEEKIRTMIKQMEKEVLEDDTQMRTLTLKDFKEVLHDSLYGKFNFDIDEFLCEYDYDEEWDWREPLGTPDV